VQNDRYGIHPAFWFADDDRFCIAANTIDVQEVCDTSEPDDDAIAAFLRLGFFLGDDTPFRRIRALSPGSDLTWSPGELKCDTTRRWTFPEPTKLSRPAARREFGCLFQEAVEALWQEGVHCVPLSGGQDSRHILLALLEAGHRPDFVATLESPPPRINTDVETARRLTAELNLPHRIFRQTPDVLSRELRKNRMTGLCADEHAWFLPLADFCHQQRVSRVWDGLAGDYLSSGRVLEPQWLQWFRSGDLEPLAEVLLGDEGYLPKMLTPDNYHRWNRDVARRRLLTELDLHRSAPNPVLSFFFCNRVRRELALAPFSLMAQRTAVTTPYLDRKVFDLLVSLPTEMMLDQQFHMETIREFYPWMPDVPFLSISKFGSDLVPRSVIRRFCRELAAYSLRPISGSRLVRRDFLIPRLLKGCVSRTFGSLLPISLSRLIVLLQLEDILNINRPADAPAGA
ncbi:MAG: hypothetical protein KDA89_04075, partial [Planctomycetaceae bacterium]|nr:hypothetical protein [Planctomycetaceae bacterium]